MDRHDASGLPDAPSTTRSRSGRGWAMSTAWARPSGASASGAGLPGRLRPGGAVCDTRARYLRADRGSVLGQLVTVHASVRQGAAHTVQPAADDLAPTLREFWADRDVSGLVLVLSGIATLAARSIIASLMGYEVGGAAPAADRRDRAAPRRRCGPRTTSRMVDPDTADPGPPGGDRGAAAPGRATRRWNGAGAHRRAAEVRPGRARRRPERRTMAGVHAPDRPPAARSATAVSGSSTSTPAPAKPPRRTSSPTIPPT